MLEITMARLEALGGDGNLSIVQRLQGEEEKRKWGEQWDTQAMNYLLELGPIDFLRSILAKHRNSRCLILGVGSELSLVNRFTSNVVGINISLEELSRAKRLKTDLILGDAEKPPLRKSCFDLVVCKSTLHHLTKLNVSILELSRILREGGYVVLYEPGLLNPIALFGRKLFPTDIHVAFEKPFNPLSLKKTLTKVFRVVNESYFFLFVHIFPIFGKWMGFFRNTHFLRVFYNFDALFYRTPFRNLCWILIYVLKKR